MLSTSAAASPAGPSSFDLIEDLQDELAVNSTILASIQDGPQTSDTPRQIAEAKRDIARIRKAISRARRRTQVPKRAYKSNSTMNTCPRPDASAGPSYHSNSGNGTPASVSTSATSSTGPIQRKRPFGPQFDDDDPFGARAKSRRTTPSPLQTAITTPSAGGDFFGDDDSVIDLTGDDADIERTLQQQKLAFAQLEHIKEDERLARSLQHNLQDDSSSNSMPASPAPTGPNAFDRILGRPSQSSQGQMFNGFSSQGQPSQSQLSQRLPSHGLPEQSFGQASGPFGCGPSLTNRYHVPGSFDYEDEDDFDDYESPSYGTTRPYGASVPGSSNTSLPMMGPPPGRSSAGNFYPMITPGAEYTPNVPAADLARQAAIARQQGYDPSGGYGPGVLPPPTYANGFASYAGDSSPMASMDGRPGMLNSGSYAPLQSWTHNVYPQSSSVPPGLSGSYMSHMINQTNQIDWDNGLDADGNPISDRLRTFAEDLYDDPRKTAEEIKDLLANIRPDEDIPEEDRVGTPEALRYPLYPHQQLALQWMMNTEEGKNKSGILADDSK